MEENNSQIFRQKSLDRINSPEELDRYIKTTNPSVWVLLCAIIVFLAGIITWSTVGKFYSEAIVGCEVKGGNVSCALESSRKFEIVDESYIYLNNQKVEISKVEGPVEADSTNSYITYTSGIAVGDWFYLVEGNAPFPDGKYQAELIFETISPIEFMIDNKR